ncbi:hypothetical protein WN55_01223, partial [Dufourea novaeangliae]
ESMNLLRTKFPDRIISRNSAVNWPLRLYNLRPLEYFLRGYVKDQVYANNPQSIEALKINIRSVIDEIGSQLCKNVIENFDKKIDLCKRGRSGHLADTLFDS